jgi:hypothetical protein
MSRKYLTCYAYQADTKNMGKWKDVLKPVAGTESFCSSLSVGSDRSRIWFLILPALQKELCR